MQGFSVALPASCAPCARPRHPLEHVSQDPRGLAYAVFLGDAAAAFDAHALTIVQQAYLRIGGYVIDAAIIGESHFVRVRDARGRVRAVELLACIEPARCGGPPTRVESYGRGALDVAERLDAVEVATAIRTQQHRTTGGRGVPRPRPGQCGAVLAHAFPGPAAPRTLVAVRADTRPLGPLRWETSLRIDTVHEYVLADHVAVVTSDTTIRIAEAV